MLLCWRKPMKAVAAGMGLPTWRREYHQISQGPVPICIMLKGYTTIIYRWPRARPQQLQCVGKGATAVPHRATDIPLYFPKKAEIQDGMTMVARMITSCLNQYFFYSQEYNIPCLAKKWGNSSFFLKRFQTVSYIALKNHVPLLRFPDTLSMWYRIVHGTK